MSTPDLFRDPRGWFAFYDANHDGRLEKSECIRGLVSSIRSIDRSVANEIVSALWEIFDPSKRGLTSDQFCAPGGLCDTLRDQLSPSLIASSSSTSRPSNRGYNHAEEVNMNSTFGDDPYNTSPRSQDGSMGSSVPNIHKHPRHWFNYFDTDHNGLLDRRECKIALSISLPYLSEPDVAAVLDSIWLQYDPMRTDFISMDEFIRRGGLCEMLLSMIPPPSSRGITSQQSYHSARATTSSKSPRPDWQPQPTAYSSYRGQEPMYAPTQHQQFPVYQPPVSYQPPDALQQRNMYEHHSLREQTYGQYAPQQVYAPWESSAIPSPQYPPVGVPARSTSPVPRYDAQYQQQNYYQPPAIPPPQPQRISAQQVSRASEPDFARSSSSESYGRLQSYDSYALPPYQSGGSMRVEGVLPEAVMHQHELPQYQAPIVENVHRKQPPSYQSLSQSEYTKTVPAPAPSVTSSAVGQPVSAPNPVSRTTRGFGSNENLLKARSSRSIQQSQSTTADFGIGLVNARSNRNLQNIPLSPARVQNQMLPETWTENAPSSGKGPPSEEVLECPFNIATDPTDWFRFYDKDNKGHLERKIFSLAVISSFRDRDPKIVGSIVDDIWVKQLRSAAQTVSLQEFAKKDGICELLLQQLHHPAESLIETQSAASAEEITPPCPNIRSDPRGWFQYFDKDRNGYLDREECEVAFIQTFKDADPAMISVWIDSMWYDVVNKQTKQLFITDFLRSGGLCEFILAQIPPESPRAPRKPQQIKAGAANIYRDRVGWFHHYDSDHNGWLDQDECVIAFTETFPESDSSMLRSWVQDIWEEVANQQTGLISLEDFVRSGGLCEYILDQIPAPLSNDSKPAVEPSVAVVERREIRAPNKQPQQLQTQSQPQMEPERTVQLPPPKTSQVLKKTTRDEKETECPVDIYSDPKGWFRYFDKDNSGFLDREECRAAFAITFKHVDQDAINETLDALWPTFVNRKTQMIGVDDFVREEGMCDVMISSLPRPVNAPPPSRAGNSRSNGSKAKPRSKLSIQVECPVDIYDDPRGWFQFFDTDHSGYLDQDECKTAFSVTFKDSNIEAISSTIDALWFDFVNPKTKLLAVDDFVRSDGLCDSILATIPRRTPANGKLPAKKSKALRKRGCPVDIYSNPREWFQYFDKDNSGTLDQQECVRGMKMTLIEVEADEIEASLDAIWEDFADDEGNVTIENFVRKDGLCDLILSELPVPSDHVEYIPEERKTPLKKPPPTSRSPGGMLDILSRRLSMTPRGAGKKKAVLVGANYYGTTGMLQSSIHDIEIMWRLLTETYEWSATPDPKNEIKILRDNTRDSSTRPNRKNIINALKWLVEGAKKGDTLVFHYSGHATQVYNEIDEKMIEECIVPVDFKTSGFITDDELARILIHHLPEGVRLTVVMDCCRSGPGLQLPFQWQGSQKSSGRGGWSFPSSGWFTAADVVLFVGCTDNLQVDERKYTAKTGALTAAFCGILKANPYPSYLDLMRGLGQQIKRNRTDIRPQLSSSQTFDLTENELFLLDNMGRANKNKKLGAVVTDEPPHPRPLPRDRKVDQMLGNGNMTGKSLDEEIDLEIT